MFVWIEFNGMFLHISGLVCQKQRNQLMNWEQQPPITTTIPAVTRSYRVDPLPHTISAQRQGRSTIDKKHGSSQIDSDTLGSRLRKVFLSKLQLAVWGWKLSNLRPTAVSESASKEGQRYELTPLLYLLGQIIPKYYWSLSHSNISLGVFKQVWLYPTWLDTKTG